jgi:hypothetical protein
VEFSLVLVSRELVLSKKGGKSNKEVLHSCPTLPLTSLSDIALMGVGDLATKLKQRHHMCSSWSSASTPCPSLNT